MKKIIERLREIFSYTGKICFYGLVFALLYSMNAHIQSGESQSLVVTTKSINAFNIVLMKIFYMVLIFLEEFKIILSPTLKIDKNYIFSRLKSLAVSVIIIISSIIYYSIGFTVFLNTYINSGKTEDALIILLISGGLLCLVTKVILSLVQKVIFRAKKNDNQTLAENN